MPDALAAQIELSLADTPPLGEDRDAVGLTVVARRPSSCSRRECRSG